MLRMKIASNERQRTIGLTIIDDSHGEFIMIFA
jgi:hypothetical protein